MCQDTGTAIVMGKKGQAVWTGGGDEEAIARGVYKTYTETNLRYSQVAPLSMFKEVQHRHQPAGADRHLCDRGRRLQVPVRRQGRRLGQQDLPAPADPGRAERGLAAQVPRQKIRTLGTAACPPYHLAIVVGGTSAEMNLKTVKLASTRYLDDLPTKGNNKGHAFRDREMEQKVLELTRQMGIGAQFGGKYFCHDVRVIRMPRHGASCRSASASPARPTARPLGKITKDGVFLEQLEHNPAQFLPEVERRSSGRRRRVGSTSTKADGDISRTLTKHPMKTRCRSPAR
jgi:fumarate hydratase class I